MLTRLVVVISKYIQISNHYVVYLKLILYYVVCQLYSIKTNKEKYGNKGKKNTKNLKNICKGALCHMSLGNCIVKQP